MLVLGLTLAGTAGRTLFIAEHREWPGLVVWFDRMAARIPRGALVYSDAPGFAAPLRFMYGIQAYEVHAMAPDRTADPMAMVVKKAERDAVFWLTQSGVPRPYAACATATAVVPLRSAILGTCPYAVPRYVRPRGGAFTLYSIAPGAGLPKDPSPVRDPSRSAPPQSPQ